MTAKVPYATLTYQSPSRVKRWSHNLRFATAIEAARLRPGESILDFGSGDGHLLVLAAERKDLGRLVAFEPVSADQARANLAGVAAVIDSFDLIPADAFDVVFCMEVLEHLTDRDSAIERMLRAGKREARFVVTVPIEIGPSALAKFGLRALARRIHKGTTLRGVANAVVGRTERIKRIEKYPGYIASHLGFDYREIPPLLNRHGLTIQGTSYSPLSLLGPVVNSQVTFVATRRQ